MLYENKKIIKFNNPDAEPLIDWIVNDFCNFKCSYCFSGVTDGTVCLPPLTDQIKNNLRHLITELQQYSTKKVRFDFMGGEPTVDRRLIDYVSFLRDSTDASTKVLTNCSRSIRWWEENGKYFDIIYISYHIEYVKYEHVINVVKRLREIKKENQPQRIVICVMVMQDRFEETLEVYNNLLRDLDGFDVLFNISLVRYEHLDKKLKFTKEQLEIAHNIYSSIPMGYKNIVVTFVDGTSKKFSPEDIKKLQGSYLNYNCEAHKTFANISRTGDIGKLHCGTIFTEPCNIFNPDFITKFKISDKSIKCTTGLCSCMQLQFKNKSL